MSAKRRPKKATKRAAKPKRQAAAVAAPTPLALEDWHERFCWNYASTSNAAQSYSKARGGEVKPSSAATEAWKLLQRPEIIARLAEVRTQLRAECQVEAADVIRELKRIGMARLSDVVQWTDDPFGNLRVTVTDSADLDDDTLAAISEISRDDNEHGVKVRVKMHDKGAALLNLGKALGMFTDVVKHEGEVKWVVEAPPQMGPEEWAKRYGQGAGK